MSTKGCSYAASLLLACLCHHPGWAQKAISTPYLPSASNFRDLAGISAAYGGSGYANETSHDGVMRTGVFYRSEELGKLSAKDLEALSSLGISRVIDLRTQSEIAALPDIPPTGASEVNYDLYAGQPPAIPIIFPDASIEDSLANVTTYAHSMYRDFVKIADERAALRAVLLDLSSTEGPELYHCSGGKDRTGWVSAILESIAGVSKETIVRDYLASDSYTAAWMDTQLASIPSELWPIYMPLLGVRSDFIEAAFDQVIADYGSMTAYLRDGLGLTQADIYVLRAKMVDYRTLPGQAHLTGNAAGGAAFLNSLQGSPLSGHYTDYNYYLQSAIDAGTLGGVESRVGGQVHADAIAFLTRQPQLIDDALALHASGRNIAEGGSDAWMAGIAGYQEASSRSGISSSEDRSSGIVLGATHRFDARLSAYLGAGFVTDTVESASAEADIDSYFVALGGRYALSALEAGPYVSARLSAGALDYRSTRPLGDGLGAASGQTHGNSYSARVDVGDIFDFPAVTLTPQIGVLVAHTGLAGFHEHGSELALDVDGHSRTMPSVLAELRADLTERRLGSWVIAPSALLGYELALDSSDATSTGALYGYSLSQESAYESRSLAKLGVGITARRGPLSLQLSANAVAGENIESIGGASINIAYRF